MEAPLVRNTPKLREEILNKYYEDPPKTPYALFQKVVSSRLEKGISFKDMSKTISAHWATSKSWVEALHADLMIKHWHFLADKEEAEESEANEESESEEEEEKPAKRQKGKRKSVKK